MNTYEIIQSINVSLIHTAYIRFEQASQYVNVISPFSRLYFIEEGEGELIIGGNKTQLEAGHLYLIPSFTPCTYRFGKDLGHYFIHCSLSLNNGLSPYNLCLIKNKIAATILDGLLFKRLLAISPGLELPHYDPKVYQKKLWMNKKVNYKGISTFLETCGIIKQIYSRFLGSELANQAQSLIRYNIQPILIHIRNNIKNEITVQDLAEMACLSKDHFSRVFKAIVGTGPCEFIIRQRLELAQLLLLTTDQTLEQIVEETNFKTSSYFSRIFKKYNKVSPSQYRKHKDAIETYSG